MEEIFEKVKAQLTQKLTQAQELSLEDLKKVLEMAIQLEDHELLKERERLDIEMIKKRCQ